jgi:hypothetical protein
MRWLPSIVLAACAGAAPVASPPIAQPSYPLERAVWGERRVYELINLERTRHGLPRVAWSDELALAARRGLASLDDPGTLPPAVANVAQSETPDSAHVAVMANPSLRQNLLSPDVTHVGVGVLPQPLSDGVLVTEIFARASREIDTVRAAYHLRDALVDHGVDHHPKLDPIAQQYANGLASGRTRQQVWEQVRGRILDIDRRYVKVRYSVTTGLDPALIVPRDVFGKLSADAFGVGIAQSTRHGIGGGTLWVVVMIGQVRSPFRWKAI